MKQNKIASRILFLGVLLACLQMAWAEDFRYFFFAPPNTESWSNAVPMVSEDGGETGEAMTPVKGIEGLFVYVYDYEKAPIPEEVVVYRDDDTERKEMIGMYGVEGMGPSPDPIDMELLMEFTLTDSIFMVTDASANLETHSFGGFVTTMAEFQELIKNPKKDAITVNVKVSVVYSNAKDAKGNVYEAPEEAFCIPGKRKYVPIYVSVVRKSDSGSLMVYPEEAAGEEYLISTGNNYRVGHMDASGEFVPIKNTDVQKVGSSGVDTLYVELIMLDLYSEEICTVKVDGSRNELNIKLVGPDIEFVSSKKPGASIVTGPDNENLSVVHKTVNLDVAVFKPDGKGGKEICKECEISDLGVGRRTSNGVDATEEKFTFEDGYTTITVYSTKEYSPSDENPAYFELCYYGKCVGYTPLYFFASKEKPAHKPSYSLRQDLNIYQVEKSTLAISTENLHGISYVVMDLQGRLIKKGLIRSNETLVSGIPTGPCVIKIGSEIRKVNVR